MKQENPISFNAAAARKRCMGYRRRILDISQTVTALHAAGAFSCLEIVDAIYHGLMKTGGGAERFHDLFIMSKGHGCMAQYVILESLGIMPAAQKRHQIPQQSAMAAGEQGDEFCLPIGWTVRRGIR